MYAAGFYMYSSFALVFWETRRSDFVVSMAHHIATVILILLSYIFRYVWKEFLVRAFAFKLILFEITFRKSWSCRTSITILFLVKSYLSIHAYYMDLCPCFLYLPCLDNLFWAPLRFARVGSAILAIHEGSDVLLELAKMSKYSGFECMASSLFVVFVLSWTILRLIYFPLWIIWSTRWV